jgi:hypothetical protein
MTSFILTEDQLEDAVVTTLKKTIGGELSLIEQQLGLDIGYYQRPRSYEVRNRFDSWPEEMLPRIVVVSIGTDNEPTKDGGRKYRADWDIGVTCIASSLDMVHSRRYAYRLGAAVRAALADKPSLYLALGGRVRGVEWLGVRNNEVPDPEPGDRTLWASRQAFRIEVGDVLTAGTNVIVPEPPEDPAPDPDDVSPPLPVLTRDRIITTYTKEPVE